MRTAEFAGVMSGIDPASITTYQIEARPDVIQGNAVLVPRIDGDNMQAILSVFRGEAMLIDAPDQVFDGTTGAVADGSTTTTSTDASTTTTALDGSSIHDADPTVTTTTSVATGTTLPNVVAEENAVGVVPESLGDNEPKVTRALPTLEPLTFPIWLTTHRELRSSRRVRLVYDLLAEALA